MGPPHKIEELGTTEVPFDLFAEYLHSISPDFKQVTVILQHMHTSKTVAAKRTLPDALCLYLSETQ